MFDCTLFRPNRQQVLNLCLIIAFSGVFDQLTKQLFMRMLISPNEIFDVLPFLNIVYRTNTGMAFSLGDNLGEFGRYFFITVALIVSVGLFIWVLKGTTQLRLLSVGLVIGGALGNTVDRLRIGGVVDFLDFHAFGWHYPTFNLADTLIFSGVMLMLWDYWRLESLQQDAQKTQEQP